MAHRDDIRLESHRIDTRQARRMTKRNVRSKTLIARRSAILGYPLNVGQTSVVFSERVNGASAMFEGQKSVHQRPMQRVQTFGAIDPHPH